MTDTQTREVQLPPCHNCGAIFGSHGHFRITHFNGAAQADGEVRVCSLKCLVEWTYRFGIHQGTRLAGLAQGFLQQLGKFLRGNRP